MLSRLERITMSVSDLERAEHELRTLLGRLPRSSNDQSATFQLENVLFELALDVPRAASSTGRFQITFATDDLESARRALGERSLLEPGAASEHQGTLPLSRRACGGLRIAVVEAGPGEPAEPTSSDALYGLDHLVVRSRDPEACRRTYEHGLGLRVALDREFPDWGVRLIFCRIRGVTIEIASRLDASDRDTAKDLEPDETQTRDSIYGFTWQTRDLDATHARLDAAGLDISDVRPGRRPGTRVFTVRSGTGDVPTLVIEPADRPVGT